MSHYDFILFENFHQAQNHKYDMILIARMLASQGMKVAILDVYGEDCTDSIEGIPVIHLPFKFRIPADGWQSHPKNKLYNIACKLRFLWEQHWHMRRVMDHIMPLADNFYAGSLYNLMSTRLMISKKPVYLWGLRSSWLDFSWRKFFAHPVETVRLARIRHKLFANSECRLFVSNHIIRDEFIKMGLPSGRVVVREERCIENKGDASMQSLSDKLTFLVIGKLREEKNVPFTVEAFRMAMIPSAELYLVGKSLYPYEGSIETAINGDCNIKRVNKFLEYSDFNEYFRMSHFVLFADERGESCITNGTMMEALINHRPVICPDYDPYSYYVKKYGIGLLYRPGDSVSYSQTLRKAAELGVAHFQEAIDSFLDTIRFESISCKLAEEVRPHLNVVFLGNSQFPRGDAMTKRWRYMIDYMNSQNIPSHYLRCDFKQRGRCNNPESGKYGHADYVDITSLAERRRYFDFFRKGKDLLHGWYVEGDKNILIFNTQLFWHEWPFYSYARKLGYRIVFDHVETSYLLNGKVSFLHRLNILFSEWLSSRAYRNSAAFTISSALEREVINAYPGRMVSILPNSTPVLSETPILQLSSPLTLLYSGTYSLKDGVSNLIDAVKYAHAHNCDCRLILLGKGDAESMKVLDSAAGCDFIEYRGFVSDEELIETMLSSDVLCMTRTNSKFANYGFPFKLSEYLATGRVVLATDVSDVSLYLEDKVSAFIAEPGNPKSIAEAIIYIDSHREEAVQIAQRGLDVMKNSFSIEKTGLNFVSFLKEI